MSILIKGMDMPVIELEWTIRHGADGKWYAIDTNAETSDGEWHEIVPVPTPHGRLIDRDAFSEFYRNQPYDPKLTEEELRREKIQRENIDLWVLNYFFDRDAPTIIEAEEENEN